MVRVQAGGLVIRDHEDEFWCAFLGCGVLGACDNCAMQNTLRFSSLVVTLSALTVGLLLPLSTQAASITVVMTDNVFTQKSVSINAGDTVTWVNQGNTVHTATADSGNFDSGPIQSGQQFSATFNQTGIYSYHDAYNGGLNGAGMAGSIIVNASTVTGTYSGTYANPNAGYYTTTNTPVYTGSSGSTAQLAAQVQALLAQISALQAQGSVSGLSVPVYTGTTGISSATPGVNSSACPNIGRALSPGSSGDDVTRLQQFLARDPSVYPEAQVTGYYGSLTQMAVQRWQTKYNIVSSGTPSSTGFGVVGPRTAAAISLQCSTMSGGGTVSGGTGTGTAVGGFIQVTPVSGNAPLSVNVTATVNTGGSCVGATYTLNFGDGTVPQQIPTSAGNCSQQGQTYQHTYVYGGTYQVTLSAGSHTTGTTVTVNGPSAPAGSGVGTGTAGQARGTISAFTTSGNVPLPVTFYVSCAAGTAYNVVFGDGVDLGSTAVSNTKCGTGGLDSISHTYTQAGSYQVQLVIFSQQSNGTVTPTTAATLNINAGSVAANYSYNPPQLSPGATALSFSLQFDLPTACTGYDLSWGDGTADAIQTDGGSACAQTTTIKNVSHTYTQAGSYTLTLRRGASLGKTNTIAVTVSQ